MATPESRIDTESIATLKSEMHGDLIDAKHAGYVDACALWNGMIAKRPALIARCANTEDVVRSVKFAREQGLALSVRGGGHSVAGNALVDDGLVVDLSGMRDVSVDPEQRVAHAGGGATWGDFDTATHAHGLATTGGQISSTGIAGLTLGGGFGWLMRSYGMACDNLIGAEVVTADGSVLNVNDSENADLLWGLRGGGGNFGVVTRFDFRLHPVHTVLGGMIVHPIERAPESLRFLRDFNRTAPDDLAVFAALMTTPEGDRVNAFILCYSGDLDEGQEVIKPLLEWGEPVMTQVGPMPYTQMQTLMDEAMPPGLQIYWRGEFIKTLTDDVIDTLIERFGTITSPLSLLLLEQFGGAVSRVPKDATAFVHRDAEYNVAMISRWEDPSQHDSHVSWARETHDAIRPFSAGAYVNYLGEEGEDRIRAAYGPDTYDRLAKLKAKYDPENVFKANQNIQPAR